MNNFRAAVDECGLRDVPWEGYNFSYDNGQVRDANRQYHAPLKLVLNCREEEKSRKRCFRFEQIWVGEEECCEAIERGVARGRGNLVHVLEECARELRRWKGTSINQIRRSIGIKNKQLDALNDKERSEEVVLRRCKLVAEIAGEKKRKNHIAQLVDDEGVTRSGDDAVAGVAINYFQSLFQSSNPIIPEDVLHGIEQRVNDDMNARLRRAYSEDEVIDALNQMHPLKAPGPDGMNAYKLVSKVLANRLKEFLREIVSENQSAFTPGRSISDNVMIAFELFHFMKMSRSREAYMAIKLDMEKAYDRVEWSFLRRVLSAVGFDREWVSRVMACVTTVSFSVLINGQPTEAFNLSRGLRQGDPLSPYLFILCAEVLSSLMRRAVEMGSLHGIRVANNAPLVSHLLFAEDSIFFTRARIEEADATNSILRRYEDASGQLVSLAKTTVSFSKGIPLQKRSNLATRLGIVEVQEQERYLGLPTVVGKLKKVLTDILRDKLSKRLSGWRGKILSRAGKEVLIKAVTNSLPTYVMSIFKIPVNFCDELKSLISRFWWGFEEGKKGISWVAWSRLCQSKSRGGMGFRDFYLFNMALLGKQVWRLLTEPDGLWARVMRARYYPEGDIMTAELGSAPSYTWRGIVEARRVLDSGWRRRVGDGLGIRVWRDAWLPETQTGRVLSPLVPGKELMTVAKPLDNGGGWNESLLAELFLPFECERIKRIRVSSSRPPDDWFWVGEKDGVFTVKSANRRLAGDREALELGGVSDWGKEKWLWNRLWKIPVWPRVKLFFWQLCSEALATRANIATLVRVYIYFVIVPLLSGSGKKWVSALWEHRYKVIFDGWEVDHWRVLRRALDVMEETEGRGFVVANREKTSRRAVRDVETRGWEPPKAGVVKINVDAGAKEGEGVSWGAGANSEWVTLDFEHSQPTIGDWIGVFSLANFSAATCAPESARAFPPLLCTAPIKFQYENYSSPEYNKTGKGTLKLQLINQRCDLHEYTGGGSG
ncbi:uncharacterized protein LOC141632812 [Silene latifolia]|uniref:uncharacterized protein LOC141632812 n=1 Tax=Silene latifolia TaxID=37657 RepID=UPI003D77605B